MLTSTFRAGWLVCFSLVLSTSWAVADEENRHHIVMLIAEREYDTDKSLADFAGKHLKGYRVSTVRANQEDRNSLVGIEALFPSAC